jgi:hypothetical protein
MSEYVGGRINGLGLIIPKALPKVAIIILNWNGWEDAIECLESLQHQNYPNYQIILVDNGSTDESVEKIKQWCKGEIKLDTEFVRFSEGFKPVEYVEYQKATAEIGGNSDQESRLGNYSSHRKIVIIETGENVGFTGGNNVGIKYALKSHYDYFWLLNSDIVVDKEALTELVKFAETNGKAGIVSPKFFDYENPENIQFLGSNKVIWPSPWNNQINFWGQKYIQFRWLGGASLLIKRQVVEQIGLLDENYFLYGEETDWCLRATRKGWKLYCVLDSKVWHKNETRIKIKRVEKYFLGKRILRLPWKIFPMRAYYESRNGLYFVRKNYPYLFLPYFVGRTFHLILQVLLYDDRKIPRVILFLKGTWHGLIGKMGKTIDPSN